MLPQTPNVTDADVILGLEVQDFWGMTHQMTPLNRFGMESRPTTKPGAKIITISAVELNHKSNYQDFGRYVEADLAITGDAEATLPELIEAVKKLITSRSPARRCRSAARRSPKRAAAGGSSIANWPQSAGMPAPSARRVFPPNCGRRSRTKTGRWFPAIGWSVRGQRACGTSTSTINTSERRAARASAMALPAAVGAALANRKHGRLTINIQNDGDLNYAPGVLWTAAHHKIPLLNIMHNNRAYHEERMYIQMFGAKFNRGIENGDIGTALISPNIDYASIAKGYGLYAEGPITDPKDLAPAIRRAIETGEGRRTRASRCRDTATLALKDTMMKTFLVLLPLLAATASGADKGRRCPPTASAFSCATAAISATARSDKADWQDHAWRKPS